MLQVSRKHIMTKREFSPFDTMLSIMICCKIINYYNELISPAKEGIQVIYWSVTSRCTFFVLDIWRSPLPDDKIMTLSSLKAFADDKINVTKMIISGFDREENIVGTGENAG